MSTQDNGGPAFPTSNDGGMTLRDYFAAKAMQALIEHNPRLAAGLLQESDDVQIGRIACAAEGAYEMADAMLKMREA